MPVTSYFFYFRTAQVRSLHPQLSGACFPPAFQLAIVFQFKLLFAALFISSPYSNLDPPYEGPHPSSSSSIHSICTRVLDGSIPHLISGRSSPLTRRPDCWLLHADPFFTPPNSLIVVFHLDVFSEPFLYHL